MPPQSSLNRRQFLGTSAALAAGAFLPGLLTSCAPSRPKVRRPGPNERINVAMIGFGTMSQDSVNNFLGDPRVQVVAVADPVSELGNYGYSGERQGGRLAGKRTVEKYYEQWNKGTYRGCNVYEDFREMLDKDDIDAVYVGTPDHWHCAVALIAARKGKHIYGQKPLSLTIEEGQRMVREVEKAGVTFQTGSQQRSSIHFRTACEYIRNGRIGKVQTVKIGFNAGHTDWSKLASRNKPEPVPKELNYDLWLGPAPQREYVPALLQLNWRHNWDFSGGFVTDWGAHHLDILQWALGQDGGGPVSIENVTATLPPQTELYNTPLEFAFDVVYANGVRANVSNKHRNGLLFEGEEGKKLFVARGILEFTPDELRRKKIEPGEIRLYESNLHEKDFVDRIFDAKTPIAPVTVGHRSISIAHVANIAIRLGRSSLRWDPVKEQIIDDPEATKLMSRPMRKPYAV